MFQHIDPTCQNSESDTLVSDTYIKDNIDIVEEKLKLNKETSPNKNVSDEILLFSANLFTYLNYCPPKDFYVLSSITKSESARNILLALTSMMKTSKNAGKESYTKIFTKATEIMNLSIYKDIDVITREKKIDDMTNDFEYGNETTALAQSFK